MTRTRNGSHGDGQREDSRERPADDEQRSAEADRQGADVESATSWFASTAVRLGLTLIGVVVLLFALGQAVGLPLLELAANAVTSQTGQWLVVAFFAVLLIGAAQRGVSSG